MVVLLKGENCGICVSVTGLILSRLQREMNSMMILLLELKIGIAFSEKSWYGSSVLLLPLSTISCY